MIKNTQLNTDRNQDNVQYHNDVLDSIPSLISHENHLYAKQYS